MAKHRKLKPRGLGRTGGRHPGPVPCVRIGGFLRFGPYDCANNERIPRFGHKVGRACPAVTAFTRGRGKRGNFCA